MKSMISQNDLSKILTTLLVLVTAPAIASSSVCRDVFIAALATNPAEELAYDWPAAIYLYGAELYARKEGSDLSSKLDASYEALAIKIPKIRDPDKASLSLPAAVRATPAGTRIIVASKRFFSEEPRNSLGVIDHVGARSFLGSVYPSSVWADSLIMNSLNQLRMATTDKEKGEVLKSAKVILSSLRDANTGLFSHAYYPKLGWKFPVEYHWARGNLWVALFLVEASSIDKEFLPLLQEELRSLKKLYVSGKGLRTLLDDPSSEFESSATALFGYVLLRANDHDLEGDISSVISGFVRDKKFSGVSGPTTAFPLPFYYRTLVPRGEYAYGTGAFLLWCSATAQGSD